jgi:hypothetical protein
MFVRSMLLAGGALLLAVGFSASSTNNAYAICVGNCGTTSGADGVVSAPPGGGTYGWVSTDGGVPGVATGLFGGGINPTNGSTQTLSFSANAGDQLQYDFNYVTSDGSGFPDAAWAELKTVANAHIAWLVTAQTQASGTIIPGVNLGVSQDATLTPPAVPIIGGAPIWSPLGGSSNTCWASGCGYTDWVHSAYTIGADGLYLIVFGVVNANDGAFQSGLAFAGLQVGDVVIPVGEVPVPAALPLFVTGLAGLGWLARRRKRAQA